MHRRLRCLWTVDENGFIKECQSLARVAHPLLANSKNPNASLKFNNSSFRWAFFTLAGILIFQLICQYQPQSLCVNNSLQPEVDIDLRTKIILIIILMQVVLYFHHLKPCLIKLKNQYYFEDLIIYNRKNIC